MPECPYHGKQKPCPDCLAANYAMGEFAHAPLAPSAPYVPPQKRVDPTHIRQKGGDTCAVACCAMVGASLNCPREFDWDDLIHYMKERGVYHPGDQSIFHALDYPLNWLGLRCRMHENVGVNGLAPYLPTGHLVIMETRGHGIVVYGVNIDGTLFISDPAMFNPEPSVATDDYRLKGTGRIWEVKR